MYYSDKVFKNHPLPRLNLAADKKMHEDMLWTGAVDRQMCLHCIDTKPKIRNKCSQKRNCATTVQFLYSGFCEPIYIFPQSVCLFCCKKIGGLIVGINV
jgi:hypothetical protein